MCWDNFDRVASRMDVTLVVECRVNRIGIAKVFYEADDLYVLQSV
jgi:hypothetical protein